LKLYFDSTNDANLKHRCYTLLGTSGVQQKNAIQLATVTEFDPLPKVIKN